MVKVLVSVALIALLLSRIDTAKLWAVARTASASWLALCRADLPRDDSRQRVALGVAARRTGDPLPFRRLTSSFLVATFFNNFLPSNIGGDVVRVADTRAAAGSKTLATTIVLIDRGIGLLGLVLMAAVGATAGPRLLSAGPGVGAPMLWAGFGGAMLFTIAILAMPNALPGSSSR